jgi:hypothetical protein
MMDPLNCGRCNHDCLGGACIAGTCQPVAISQPGTLVVPFMLAIDTNWVYYVTQQNTKYQLQYRDVHDLPNATTATLGEIDGASALAAADSDVGWTTITPLDGGSIAAANAQKAQGSPVPTLLYQGMGTVGPLLGHGQYFSFGVNQQNLVTVTPGVAPNVVMMTSAIMSLAADSTHLYWALGSGAIMAGDTVGMNGHSIITEVGARFLTTRDADPNLYWILQSGNNGSIRTAPKTGGTATTIGNPTLTVLSLAVDAEAVYVASLPISCPAPGMVHGQIQRLDLTSLHETLLPGAICPFIVVTDAVCIYWTDTSAGGLLRLAK